MEVLWYRFLDFLKDILVCYARVFIKHNTRNAPHSHMQKWFASYCSIRIPFFRCFELLYNGAQKGFNKVSIWIKITMQIDHNFKIIISEEDIFTVNVLKIDCSHLWKHSYFNKLHSDYINIHLHVPHFTLAPFSFLN